MREIRSLIEQLVAAGVDPIEAAEVVARAAIAGAQNVPKQRSAGAIRQERYRRNIASQVTESDGCDDLSSPSGSSPTPPSPNPLQSIPPSPPKGGSSPTAKLKAEFESQFWPEYPHKVGKPTALKAFVKARSRADLALILDGLAAYVVKTDDRPWCNPATWLNQDRWNDRPAAVARGQPPPGRGSGNAAVDRLDELMAGRTTHDDHDGPTIEASDFDGDRDFPAQAVLGFAPTRRIDENRRSGGAQSDDRWAD